VERREYSRRDSSGQKQTLRFALLRFALLTMTTVWLWPTIALCRMTDDGV
jgi:hypothetical protein